MWTPLPFSYYYVLSQLHPQLNLPLIFLNICIQNIFYAIYISFNKNYSTTLCLETFFLSSGILWVRILKSCVEVQIAYPASQYLGFSWWLRNDSDVMLKTETIYRFSHSHCRAWDGLLTRLLYVLEKIQAKTTGTTVVAVPVHRAEGRASTSPGPPVGGNTTH